jgi:hypothetical protein
MTSLECCRINSEPQRLKAASAHSGFGTTESRALPGRGDGIEFMPV